MSDTITHYGIKLPLVRSVMSKNMINTLLNGYYENEEANALSTVIQDNEVVMELGGGIGFLSSLLARNIKIKEVHVFEANPHLIELIKHTHMLNDVKAFVYNEILGKTEKPLNFYIDEDFWSSSTILHDCKEVVTVTQSSFQARINEIKPTLLIVDIEGGEVELFDHIELHGVKKILIEIHQNVIGRHGVKHLFDTLGSEGFHYDVWHSSRQIVLFSHVNRDCA